MSELSVWRGVEWNVNWLRALYIYIYMYDNDELSEEIHGYLWDFTQLFKLYQLLQLLSIYPYTYIHDDYDDDIKPMSEILDKTYIYT